MPLTRTTPSIENTATLACHFWYAAQSSWVRNPVELGLLADLAGPSIDEEHEENNHAVQDLLAGGFDTGHLKRVLQEHDHDCPGDGAAVTTRAAQDLCSADDNSGNALENI